ncbi:hypothetical protein CC80DRAFT_563322 [Byssothecium circinans]|uniref:Uncharacterized protein n=1 Tax=Byssothecium circinans TaxID=147558 RepID=A0A6A5TXS1_9PLEO|nr:hypothetical protein CC80DRAFT_563322 [Byssothecium circinans]
MYFNFNHLSQKLFDEGITCVCLSGVAVAIKLHCKIAADGGGLESDELEKAIVRDPSNVLWFQNYMMASLYCLKMSVLMYYRHIFFVTEGFNYNAVERWANLHVLTAILCACLPICKRLWNSLAAYSGKWINRFVDRLRSSFGAQRTGNSDKTGNVKDPYVCLGHCNGLHGPNTGASLNQPSRIYQTQPLSFPSITIISSTDGRKNTLEPP